MPKPPPNLPLLPSSAGTIDRAAAEAMSARPVNGGFIEQPAFMPPPKVKRTQITRRGTSAGALGDLVTAANRWRENFNALTGLDLPTAVAYLNASQRGDTAYLQWTFRRMERGYATLSGLMSRCEGPMLGFDWHIKQTSVMPRGMQEAAFQALADEQKACLEEAYNRIDNLREGLMHLALADFRGYAHLQKHRDADGAVNHLEPLHQWTVCRDGLEGQWFWNPDSKMLTMPLMVIGPEFAIGGDYLPAEDFIIREVPRPINEIALVYFIRASMVEKFWDSFLTIYGLPGGIITMPGGIPADKVAQFEAAAKAAAESGHAALPSGSTYTPNDHPRGTDPFTPRLNWVTEQIVLAGTGGKLTMLTESGSGTLAGGAHSDTFHEIADGRARRISELMQRQFDAEVLEREFPGQPRLVYFDWGAEEQEDLNGLVANVVSLAGQRYRARVEWLQEKLGYQLEEEEQPEPIAPGQPGAEMEEGEEEDEGESETGETEEGETITNRDGFVTIDGHVVFVGPENDTTDEGGDRANSKETSLRAFAGIKLSEYEERTAKGIDHNGLPIRDKKLLKQRREEIKRLPQSVKLERMQEMWRDVHSSLWDSYKKDRHLLTQKPNAVSNRAPAASPVSALAGTPGAVLNFDPDQPRDEAGRWTAEGAGLDDFGKRHLENWIADKVGPEENPNQVHQKMLRWLSENPEERDRHGWTEVRRYAEDAYPDSAAGDKSVAPRQRGITDKELQHLARWSMAQPEATRDASIDRILKHLQQYPDALEKLSWPEIDALTKRNQEMGFRSQVSQHGGRLQHTQVQRGRRARPAGAPLTNRAPASSPVSALAGTLGPLRERLDAIAAVADPATQRSLLNKFLADWPGVRAALAADDSLAAALHPQIVKSFLKGLTGKERGLQPASASPSGSGVNAAHPPTP